MAGAQIETSRLYALEPGGTTRLELRWGASFAAVRVLLDGAEVASLQRKALAGEGAKVALPDGSALAIRLRGMLGIELLRDGRSVPGSDLDPKRLLRNAGGLMVILAVVDAATDGALFRRGITHGPVPLALDGALLALAIATLVGRPASRVALALGVGAFATRFGLGAERSTWTLIYGLVATWLLATHFFGTFGRRR